MKKCVEIILKNLLVVILFICVLVFGIFNILSNTVFNQEFTLKKLEETNYYANIYTQIKLDFENYIYQSGLDENVIENIILPEEVKKDTRKIIVGIYNGIYEDVDTTKVCERLNDNINSSLEGKKIDEKTQKSINSFVDQIANQYKETITKTEYEKQIYQGFSKMKKTVDFWKKITIILAVIIEMLIIATYYKKLFKNIAYIGTALFGDGIAFIFLKFYIIKKVNIKNLIVLNDAITITLRDYLSSILNIVTTYGCVLVVLGLILIVVGNFMHGKKYYSKN